MKNQGMHRFAALLFFLLMICFETAQAKENGAVNVLLITLDTVRADSIGAYGHREIKTPHIDALCNTAAMFRRAYTPVPLTLPAHASIMTGKVPPAHQVRVNGRYRLADEELTMAEILQANGYLTHAVIASYVLHSRFGTDQGFSVYDDNLQSDGKNRTVAVEISAQQVYRKFSDWFEKNHRRRFFSWVHFYDPHMPYNPPKEFIRKGFEQDKRRRYEGEIEYVDRFVGRIVGDLKAKGKLNETLIVLVGDHGEAFGEHLEFGHSIFGYEENLRIPMVFHLPGRIPHRQVDEPVGLIDVLPTVLDLLGMKPVPGIQGVSLVPILSGRFAGRGERVLYFESMWGKEEQNWAPLMGILDRVYKYVNLPNAELYHLMNDPAERMNLYRREPGIARAYDAKLQALLSTYANTGPAVTHDPGAVDLKKLESLGYIPSPSARTRGIIDPKRGVVLQNKLERLGRQIARGEDLAGAEAELREVLTKSPDLKSPQVYDLLFRIYHTRSDQKNARLLCEQALTAFPDSVQIRSNLVSALAALQLYPDVITQCKEILKINPLYIHAHLMLGEIYNKTGRSALSLLHYREAYRLEPENIPMRQRYAELLLKTRQHSRALEIYNGMLDKEGVARNHELLYTIAQLNARLGTLAQAKAVFNQLVAVMPCGKYHFHYALILAQNEEYREASGQMTMALRQYSDQLSLDQCSQGRQALEEWKQKF